MKGEKEMEEVIKQSVILLLPAFESDIPPNLRLNLTKLSLLNDIQLWKRGYQLKMGHFSPFWLYGNFHN